MVSILLRFCMKLIWNVEKCHLQEDSGFHQDAYGRGMYADGENIPEISYLNLWSSHMMVCICTFQIPLLFFEHVLLNYEKL